MFPPNFIVKYWKLQKLWIFYEKYPNFKLTKLTKWEYFFVYTLFLHFVAEKAKINAEYYVNNLLPGLIGDCQNLAPNNNFIFQQDGAPAHTSRLAQEWLEQNTPDFIKKDEWPPNSPDLNPLDFHIWGAMLEKYRADIPKPSNKTELKIVLEVIWNDFPQEPIKKAVLAFRKRLQACIRADGGRFEHLLS